MYQSTQTLTSTPLTSPTAKPGSVKTLADLWGVFHAADAGRSAEKRRERAAMFAKHIEPKLGAMPLTKITQAHIEQTLCSLQNLHIVHARQKAVQAGQLERLTELPTKPLGGQRNRVLSLLSAMFRFALVRGLVKRSPIIHAAALKVKERPRTRQLQTEELRSFWLWLDRKDGEDRSLRIAIQLVILLWRRASEVTQAPWTEFDMEERRWTLPPARNKGEHDVVLPLPESVMTLLAEAKTLAGNSAYVFPTRYRKGGTHAVDKPVHRKSHEDVLERYFANHPGVPFRLHDLRRTGRTRAGRLGVAKHIGQMILGHGKNSVDDIYYDMNRYQPQIKAALTKWQNDVLRLASTRSAAA
jgi:hypothetical protein